MLVTLIVTSSLLTVAIPAAATRTATTNRKDKSAESEEGMRNLLNLFISHALLATLLVYMHEIFIQISVRDETNLLE